MKTLIIDKTTNYEHKSARRAGPELGAVSWVEELARSWERRADKMGDPGHIAEVVLAGSFRERASELRRAYLESSTTGALSGIGGDDQRKS